MSSTGGGIHHVKISVDNDEIVIESEHPLHGIAHAVWRAKKEEENAAANSTNANSSTT